MIQWEATEAKDATWEDLQDIVNSYPQFNLEDKLIFDEKDNVTCVKSEEVLAQNSIEKEGHVSDDLHHMGVRKSTRLRRKNILLKDFAH